MIENTFYHNTIRKYTVAFGTIFNGIKIERTDKAGNVIGMIPVPLIYSDKEKFVQRAVAASRIDSDAPTIKETLPAMGFELINMTFSPMRKTNTMERIINSDGDKGKFSFNRVPYDFNFVLYIAARRIDDALRIVEQIAPYFTPELNVRIKDMEHFNITSDVPIVLDDVSVDVDAEGNFDDRRIIQWQMTFTLKGYLYSAVRDVSVIKKAIVDLKDGDNNSFYEGYMSSVDPLNAGQADTHNLTGVITSTDPDDEVITGDGGSTLNAELV